VSTALTIPLLLGLARMTVAPWLPAFLSDPLVQLALATPVQLWAAQPFYAGAWRAIRHGVADMNTLVVVGTSAAYLYSVARSSSGFLPGRRPGRERRGTAAVLRHRRGDHHPDPGRALSRSTGAILDV
jgi:hypothetical protein